MHLASCLSRNHTHARTPTHALTLALPCTCTCAITTLPRSPQRLRLELGGVWAFPKCFRILTQTDSALAVFVCCSASHVCRAVSLTFPLHELVFCLRVRLRCSGQNSSVSDFLPSRSSTREPHTHEHAIGQNGRCLFMYMKAHTCILVHECT